jgi:hypothetical protein
MGEARRVCSECGWPTGEVPPARRIVRRSGALRVLAFVVGVLVYAGVQWRAWPPPGVATVIAPGVGSHEFPRERFTASDIAAYASGEQADGRLVGALRLDDPTGKLGLDVGFVPPGGTATTFRRYGWPTPLVTYRWDGTYEDVYARTGLISQPAASGPRWSSRSYITQRILADGRRESRVVAFWGAAAPLVLVVAAWTAGRFAGRALGRWPRVRRSLPWACAGGMAVMVGTLSVRGVDDADPMWPVTPRATVPGGLTVGDVVRLGERPGGEAELAAMLAPKVDDAAASNVLVIGVSHAEATSQSWGQGGWPKGLVMDSRIEPAGARARLGELRRVGFERGSVNLVYTDATGSLARRYVTVSMGEFAVGCSAVLVLVGVVGWGVRGWGYVDRRRWERRVARGLCARCGYDVREGVARG